MSAPRAVFRRVERPAAELVAGLGEHGVATILAAMDGENLLLPRLVPLIPGARVAGPVVTALNASGDNLAMHRALGLLEPGDVLLMATEGPAPGALWGELVTACARARGAVGAVVEGSVRDVDGIRRQGFPLWYRDIDPRTAAKATLGGVNVPMTVAGVSVLPGDILVADEDGVVVVPRSRAAEVLLRAQQHDRAEEELQVRLARGELYYEFAGLAARLEEQGIPDLDQAWSPARPVPGRG